MDQLKIRQSSLKKRYEYDETSQKKYGFKYYDYCDMVPNRHRIAESVLAHSVCESKVRPVNLNKSLNINKKAIRSMNDSKTTNRGPNSKDIKSKQTNLSQQLRHYKIVCKNLRKENMVLKTQHQQLKKKEQKKRKRQQNKQNIDQNKYHDLLTQLNIIQNKLKTSQATSKVNYKTFYQNFVKSLKDMGMQQPKNQKDALIKWKQIVQSIQKNNTTATN